MKRYRIYIYWILMLVPTLMIGGGAFVLLQREQNRREEQREKEMQDIARQKAMSFVERIQISLDVIQQQLIGEVTKLPDQQILGGLEKIGRSNPLARNLFLWTPDNGVIFPDRRRARVCMEQWSW